MKKLSIYLAAILALFLILFGINQFQSSANDNNPYGVKAKELDPATVKQLKDPNYQNIILPKDMEAFVAEKKTGFVYFYSPTCMFCKATTPVLMDVSRAQSVEVKQYNLLEFKEGWNKYGIKSTPTLVYFKDGAEKERLVGQQSEQALKEFVQKHKS